MQQRIEDALRARCPFLTGPEAYWLADASLAALGLRDLDAATRRAAEAIATYSGTAWQLYEGMASVVLKAALDADHPEPQRSTSPEAK